MAAPVPVVIAAANVTTKAAILVQMTAQVSDIQNFITWINTFKSDGTIGNRGSFPSTLINAELATCIDTLIANLNVISTGITANTT